MVQKKEDQKIVVKKPILVLNDATKIYLATKDVSKSEAGLFLIMSLFLPVNKGRILPEPKTEISAFEDAESASIYYETMDVFCKFNRKKQIAQLVTHAIKEFDQITK